MSQAYSRSYPYCLYGYERVVCDPGFGGMDG